MKKEQSYKNHKRTDPIYHYLMMPLALIILGLSVFLAFEKELVEGIYYMLVGLLISLGVLKVRTYAVILQNRLIRAELRMRYKEVTGNNFEELEQKLTLAQITALNYASDNELEDLTIKSAEDKLTAEQIKERIQDWKGDFYGI